MENPSRMKTEYLQKNLRTPRGYLHVNLFVLIFFAPNWSPLVLHLLLPTQQSDETNIIDKKHFQSNFLSLFP